MKLPSPPPAGKWHTSSLYSSSHVPVDVFLFPQPGLDASVPLLPTYPPHCLSIHLSVCPSGPACSLTRVWFQAESTPCKTSRSQRLRGGSREGRGGARPGFIPGRVQRFGVRSGPGGPWAWRRDGWVDPLTDDCVSPEAPRHRSQQVERVRGRDPWVELTVSCLTHFWDRLWPRTFFLPLLFATAYSTMLQTLWQKFFGITFYFNMIISQLFKENNICLLFRYMRYDLSFRSWRGNTSVTLFCLQRKGGLGAWMGQQNVRLWHRRRLIATWTVSVGFF